MFYHCHLDPRTLQDGAGGSRPRNRSSHREQRIIVYFRPKPNTHGTWNKQVPDIHLSVRPVCVHRFKHSAVQICESRRPWNRSLSLV